MVKKKVKFEPRIPWKVIFNWKRILIVFSILIIALAIFYHYGYLKKTCDTEECFIKSLNHCTPAKYFMSQDYNIYRYAVMGTREGHCRVDISLVKMAEGTPILKVQRFEGKEMKCLIGRDKLNTIDTIKIDNVLNYCSGELKEAMYEEIIEKLYTLLVSNLGDAVKDLKSQIQAGNI